MMVKVKNVDELKKTFSSVLRKIDGKNDTEITIILEGKKSNEYLRIKLGDYNGIYLEVASWYEKNNFNELFNYMAEIIYKNTISSIIYSKLMNIFRKNINIKINLPCDAINTNEIIENINFEIDINSNELENEIENYFIKELDITTIENINNILNRIINEIDFEYFIQNLIFEFYYDDEFIYDNETKNYLVEFIVNNIISDIVKKFTKEFKIYEIYLSSLPNILLKFGFKKDRFFYYDNRLIEFYPTLELKQFLESITYQIQRIYDPDKKSYCKNGWCFITMQESSYPFQYIDEIIIKIKNETFYIYRYLITKYQFRKELGEYYYRVFKQRKNFNELVSCFPQLK